MAFLYRFMGDQASAELARGRLRAAVGVHNTGLGNVIRHVTLSRPPFGLVCTTRCVGQTRHAEPTQRRIVHFDVCLVR